MKNEDLKEISQGVLTLAKKSGASDAEVSCGINEGFDVTVRMGDVETLERHLNRGITITVYFDHQKGEVSTSDISKSSLEKSVQAACNIAKYTEADPFSGLAEENLIAKEQPDLDLYHPWDISTEEAIQLVLQCEDYGRSLDKRIVNSEGVSVSTNQNHYVYANSYGFMGAVPSTSHTISSVFVAQENNSMERDYYYSHVRDYHDLEACQTIAKKAVEKTVARLNSKKLTTQKVPVIFSPEVAKSLLASFLSAISGSNLYRQASFLLDHLDKKIFSEKIHLYEDPYLLKGLGSAAFDAEGVQTQKKDLVAEGVLKSYLLGSYSARKLGMQSTGNSGGVHNLMIDVDDIDLNALIKKMYKGVLVTELIGQGVNIITGDYSRGIFGFWVDNGEIQYPISENTIAGNLKEMFLNIDSIANDINKNDNIQTGSILINEMVVAG